MDKFQKKIMDLVKENFLKGRENKKFQGGSETRSYYLFSLADNLIEPMGEKALLAYGNGSGNEIFSGKMNALRSSSALTYNLFGNKNAKIINELPLSETESESTSSKIGKGVYEVEFEKQYRTLKSSVRGKPANLDAFLYCKETGEAIACEMKMLEWIFNKPGKLKSKYLDEKNYTDKSNANIFISAAKALIDSDELTNKDAEEYSCKYESFDAFQMFKHVLACYSACIGEETRKIKKLTLVNCIWTLPTPDNFSDYIKKEKEEFAKGREFVKIMEDVIKLFKEKLGIEFDIKIIKFNEFLAMFEKTEKELEYLKRYTF